MDLLVLLILLAIVGICGAVAELIVGFDPGGAPLLSIIIGVIGAYVGSWISGIAPVSLRYPLSMRVGTVTFDLLWTVIGSLMLVLLLSVLRSGWRRNLLKRHF